MGIQLYVSNYSAPPLIRLTFTPPLKKSRDFFNFLIFLWTPFHFHDNTKS